MEGIKEFISFVESKSDKRTENWFLVGSNPIPVLVISVIYVLYVKWIGPRMMESQNPYGLRYPLVIYNAALSLLNLYIFKELVFGAIDAGFSFPCQPIDYSDDPKNMRIAAAIWWYYFSKIIEFIDTVFFILRKKNAQISFLHVYHHATMPFLWWIGVKFVAGGQSTYAASINAFVHVVMYFYYGLSAMGPQFQKYLWWKHYLTQLQLLQFSVALVHSIYSWYTGCPFPNWMYHALIFYTISFLFLFGNFYLQAYIKKQRLYTKEKLEQYSKRDLSSTNGDVIKNASISNGVSKKMD